jgi:hypothetical protein
MERADKVGHHKFLIAQGFGSPPGPTTQSDDCRDFLWRLRASPNWRGFLYDRFVTETADLWFGHRIGFFFSALKIPFPGNGDLVDRDSVRMGS